MADDQVRQAEFVTYRGKTYAVSLTRAESAEFHALLKWYADAGWPTESRRPRLVVSTEDSPGPG